MSHEDLFHGFIAVAPLKRVRRLDLSKKTDLFHGTMAVAPLHDLLAVL